MSASFLWRGVFVEPVPTAQGGGPEAARTAPPNPGSRRACRLNKPTEQGGIMAQDVARSARASTATESQFEVRSEVTTGHAWDEDAKDWLPYTALLVRWRTKGSRGRWNKVNVIPQGDQTIAGLREKLPEIVEKVAARWDDRP